MIWKLTHALVAAGLATAWVQASAADSAVNALWNDGAGFGIWLYGRTGTCSQFAYKNPPFIVLGNGGKHSETKDGTFQVTRLKVCMLVGKPDIAQCESGSIGIRYVPGTNEYVGEYNVKLSNGTAWSGQYRAQYCEDK